VERGAVSQERLGGLPKRQFLFCAAKAEQEVAELVGQLLSVTSDLQQHAQAFLAKV